MTVKNIKEFIVSEIKESNQEILHSHSANKSRYRDFCGELYLSGLSTTWKMLINTEILQAYSELELLTENKIKTVAKYQKYFPYYDKQNHQQNVYNDIPHHNFSFLYSNTKI